MTRTTPLGRYSAAAAASALLLCLTATPALARHEPGEPVKAQVSADAVNCPLRRVGNQLVRCDSLTGGGFVAPRAVPEL